MDPLSEPQIHAAIRALGAGDRPAGATLRTALLMALAWHAAQAEIAALRATCDRLEVQRDAARIEVDALIAGLAGLRRDPDACTMIGTKFYPCRQVTAINAEIAALLREPPEPEPGRTGQAEIARLRVGLAGLRRAHVTASDYYEECPQAYSADRRDWIRAHLPDWEEWLTAPCSCGADEHNAKIAALLGEPPEPPEPQGPLAPGPQMG